MDLFEEKIATVYFFKMAGKFIYRAFFFQNGRRGVFEKNKLMYGITGKKYTEFCALHANHLGKRT